MKYEISILVEVNKSEYRIDNMIGAGKDINEAIEDVSHTYRIFEGSSFDDEYSIFAFEILYVRRIVGGCDENN